VNYSGPLYGKIGRRTVPLKLTSADVDAMAAKLARLDWRPVAAGLPAAEDLSDGGEVEWSDGKFVWENDPSEAQKGKATHWRPIHLPTP
jgi:hypothetical protein